MKTQPARKAQPHRPRGCPRRRSCLRVLTAETFTSPARHWRRHCPGSPSRRFPMYADVLESMVRPLPRQPHRQIRLRQHP
jgi:hypothetical protein